MSTNLSKALYIAKNILTVVWKFLLFTIKTIWYIFERIFLVTLLVTLTVGLAWWLSQKPSLYRDWSVDQEKLASITFSGNLVNIENVRNFTYRSTTDYTPRYYNRTYNLDEIESVYYIIEPFSTMDGPAHTMLSFGFSGGTFVTVSAEVRKEKGESFDVFPGLMNQFEIVYIVGDENDLVKLRSNYRKDAVYMYPIKTPKEKMQGLFSSAMHRADQLTKEPEFYNTLWNTCTTSILRHVNALRTDKISWEKKILLPSHSDDIAYELGLIDTSLSLPEAREYYKINALSEKYADDTRYSEKIRVERK
ncbi:MAG: DUF4105 domain-containing protein [Candidatus Gracilibacteria bacterium]|nr:DUF4105 domain-containing protein [Candidatus Gracilibacteria bacterium]